MIYAFLIHMLFYNLPYYTVENLLVLVMINQKEVTQSTRQFLQNWYANKEAKKQEKLQAKERAESFDYIEGDFERDRLHSNYPYSLSNVYQDQEEVLSMSRLPNSKHLVKHHKQFVEVLAKAKEQRRLKTLPPLEQVEPRFVNSLYTLSLKNFTWI